VARYYDSDNFTNFGGIPFVELDSPTAVAVPEPSTVVMAGTGVLVLAACVRRRRAKE
jgi:hypothetical protein